MYVRALILSTEPGGAKLRVSIFLGTVTLRIFDTFNQKKEV